MVRAEDANVTTTKGPVPGLKRKLARAGWRLGLAIGVGFATVAFWPAEHSLATRILAGWDGGALALLAVVWGVLLTTDANETKRRAASADPGRTAVWVLVLIACAIGLFAGAVVMRHAATVEPLRRSLLIVLCLIAVVTAWSLTHTGFTLRYAHLFYRDDAEGEGGLEFVGKYQPSDFDFAYFAFTIGMCFQVSDVVVSSPQIRRAVLAHALLSFAYNTVILALSLNLLLGVIG
jgi:uncharacterized membrane protein